MKISEECIYEIRVEGQLAESWSEWFEGLTIQNHATGDMVLTGPLPDQAALLGILNKIQALNLTVISVKKAIPDG
jgi:hypothetical protein